MSDVHFVALVCRYEGVQSIVERYTSSREKAEAEADRLNLERRKQSLVFFMEEIARLETEPLRLDESSEVRRARLEHRREELENELDGTTSPIETYRVITLGPWEDPYEPPPPVYDHPRPRRSCNRHADCALADWKARLMGWSAADHCDDDCCEDCFGK